MTRGGAVGEGFGAGTIATASDLGAPILPIETPPETTLETVSAPKSASDQADVVSSAPRLRQTPSFHHRLPRFARAKGSHRPPLALQHRDLDLLRTVHDYRLISTPQLLDLYGDESRDGIYRRLQKLFHHGYLDRLGSNPNAPLVYSLGRRAAEALEVPVRKEPGERYVAHQLMIGNVRIALTLAARQRGVEFSWRPVRQDLQVRPDGFFSLRVPALPDGRNTAHFFLEADRSTMTRERFVEKLRAYAAWRARAGHTEALGIRHFRVVTVTKSEERLSSLLGALRAASELAHHLPTLWFTAQARFVGGASRSVFAPIWETASEPRVRKAILPAST